MNLSDSQAYAAFRDTMRRFASDKVAPYAAAVDREKRPPIEAFEASLALGLPGLPYPESLGGQDGDMLSQCIMIEELSRVCASTALTVSSCWILMAVMDYGTEAQQREIVPQITRGEARCAWGLTEPKGGSDLMGATTRAVRDGSGWVLDGTKRFITNGGWAEWYLIFARTTEKRFGLFLVHKNDPGVSFGAPERKMGMRGSPTSDVILDAVKLPADRLLGDPERGAEYITQALLRSRLHIASHALGIAAGALEETLRYTGEREQFGKPIARFQMVRSMVADMAIRVESARATLHRAVSLYQAGDPQAKMLASIAKVLCSDAAMAVTTDAVQLHGGYGYLEDYAVERMMRDAKVTQIWEGTNQIQRLMIAKDVYDVPA
ncbi:acyl-CoA dehydrogenase domain protein [Acidovorax delafieldii 2AN]|uniref:3-sulfinopropanoyl-CoA desulfinase n=1 Tax=Acidovorax delafieldii 2AN TaxID=573060 RepID=C5T0A0_ACIDE|nr:acyl-CoA dehydrogenase family protein [Acidovorax delafieldii]EER62053.1 acyl-CoA dehydrogenase domain protein [Acidovorax delafieldii 2AN]